MGDETKFVPSDKLESDLLHRIGWSDPSQVQVLEPNDLTAQFTRAKALNILHRACRSDATVLSLDIDIEVRPPAFDHIRSLVIPGVSMYFPIVWSLYNPENVESIQEKLYGKKRLPVMSVYSGVWRKFGYGIYAIAGSDAKAFHLSETFTTWGGEDDDFFSRMQQKLHIIRAKDPHLIHHWHPEHCDVTQKSCFMSKATLEGSSMAFQVAEYTGSPSDT